uniref:Uncharacterized protein n=1 Tax=Romanomermis culicivorax TaxID=13658 RepID=A0A915JIH6_ROMCU
MEAILLVWLLENGKRTTTGEQKSKNVSKSEIAGKSVIEFVSAALKQATRMFNDITDIILTSTNVIHDPTLSNGHNVLADHLETICGNLYGVDNINVKPINLIYMIYGALFTLPYTTKLEDNGVEAVLVRKTQTDLKILISYNTDDKLKIKVLIFNFGQRTLPNQPINYRPINTMYGQLKSVKKSRLLTKQQFRQVFTKIHHFGIHQTPEGRIDIQASDIDVQISIRFDTYAKYTASFSTIMPNALTKGTFDSNLIDMHSKSAKIVEKNAHKMIETVIQTYQRNAYRNQFSQKLNKMYNFIIGAFELNFGQYHNLVIQPIYDTLAIGIVDIIIKVQGQNKPWLSTTYPIVFKFVSATESEWESYELNQDPTLTEIMDKTSTPLYKLGTHANEVICLNAHYDGVLENIRGLFSDGYLIDYKDIPGVFGAVRSSDQTPLFISIIHCERKTNYEEMARKNVAEIIRQYFPEYSINPVRRTADFVSIVTSPSSGNNGKVRGMLRVSTSGRLFRQCLPMINQIRRKRNPELLCNELLENVYGKLLSKRRILTMKTSFQC